MGSALPLPLPEARWALTPPFHPGLPLHLSPSERGRWSLLCCTFLRVSATGRYPASCSMELGLSSRRASGPFGPWFTAGDRLYGIDAAQGDTASLAAQWGSCVS